MEFTKYVPNATQIMPRIVFFLSLTCSHISDDSSLDVVSDGGSIDLAVDGGRSNVDSVMSSVSNTPSAGGLGELQKPQHDMDDLLKCLFEEY